MCVQTAYVQDDTRQRRRRGQTDECVLPSTRGGGWIILMPRLWAKREGDAVRRLHTKQTAVTPPAPSTQTPGHAWLGSTSYTHAHFWLPCSVAGCHRNHYPEHLAAQINGSFKTIASRHGVYAGVDFLAWCGTAFDSGTLGLRSSPGVLDFWPTSITQPRLLLVASTGGSLAHLENCWTLEQATRVCSTLWGHIKIYWLLVASKSWLP